MAPFFHEGTSDALRPYLRAGLAWGPEFGLFAPKKNRRRLIWQGNARGMRRTMGQFEVDGWVERAQRRNGRLWLLALIGSGILSAGGAVATPGMNDLDVVIAGGLIKF